jgi:hypothetical protein
LDTQLNEKQKLQELKSVRNTWMKRNTPSE